jgi:type IV pilus assembly protein PilV
MPLEINVKIGNEHGFTLVEFLVAIVILMVGLLGMLQAIDVAMDKNLENLFRNEAVSVADDRLMLKRAKSFASLSTTTSTPPKIAIGRKVRGIFNNYSVQEIVSQTTSLSKEIVINVSWKKRKKSYSHSISTVVSTFPQ